jgi:hypothetical protein
MSSYLASVHSICLIFSKTVKTEKNDIRSTMCDCLSTVYCHAYVVTIGGGGGVGLETGCIGRFDTELLTNLTVLCFKSTHAHTHIFVYSTAVARKRLPTADFPFPLRSQTICAPDTIFSQKRLTIAETQQLSNSVINQFHGLNICSLS